MTQWQKPAREPPKTKAQFREMLTEAVRNTQPEPKRPPKAERDRSEKAAQLVSECKNLGWPTFDKGAFFAHIWPHAKSRQGFPRRLVPLRLRRGTASRGARTQPVLALIWTHATFNEAVGALPVCRANDPRSL